jgi:uncharacterized protein YgbK (DUF1537 family)
MLLGCIADDFTGATDLANNLVRGGMRTVQTVGVPNAPLTEDVDAAVVALKSRTIPAAEAVAQSLAALKWLQPHGCRQIYFKYCSTFDSTPAGNIGPVTEALMDTLGCDFTIACPAFPEAGRTIYKGHLFVGDVPLNESGMHHHPLTPMTDANLVRVLQAQMKGRVGLVEHEVVARGAGAIGARLQASQSAGVKAAIIDVLDNDDLMQLGRALKGMLLVTAGSGVAIGLPQNFVAEGLLRPGAAASALPRTSGYRAIVSGSCSVATNKQVAHFIDAGGAAHVVDPLKLAGGNAEIERALAWAVPLLRQGKGPVLLYSTAAPGAVQAIQSQLGAGAAGLLIEQALAAIARGLVDAGVDQLVVAGGETSGAVVQALGIDALRIGAQIDPGVPWTMSMGGRPVALALKSGNFGGEDFFGRAFRVLQ